MYQFLNIYLGVSGERRLTRGAVIKDAQVNPLGVFFSLTTKDVWHTAGMWREDKHFFVFRRCFLT